MSELVNENTQTSELLVVNAQDVNGETVARVIIPHRVPYGFHAVWVLVFDKFPDLCFEVILQQFRYKVVVLHVS